MRESRQFEDKYILRFPEGLRNIVKAEAAKSGRSMNAEIIFRIQESLDSGKEMERRVEALEVAVFGKREEHQHEA